jgi:hypothetical protein
MQDIRKELVWIVRIGLLTGLCFAVYFILMTAIIPAARFSIEPEENNPSKAKSFLSYIDWQSSVNDSIRNIGVSLASKEAFLMAKIGMTPGDSISLEISIPDSTVSLVVQGVSLFTAPIISCRTSKAFKKIDPFYLSYWLSTPFVVDTHYASLPKIPVLYKKAPRDTIEALSQLEPEPLKDSIDPVFFTLILDRDLSISFEQYEKPLKMNHRAIRAYRHKLDNIEKKDIFYNLIRFRPVKLVPDIRIVLDKKSARVIYRALPVDAKVALQIR